MSGPKGRNPVHPCPPLQLLLVGQQEGSSQVCEMRQLECAGRSDAGLGPHRQVGPHGRRGRPRAARTLVQTFRGPSVRCRQASEVARRRPADVLAAAGSGDCDSNLGCWLD